MATLQDEISQLEQIFPHWERAALQTQFEANGMVVMRTIECILSIEGSSVNPTSPQEQQQPPQDDLLNLQDLDQGVEVNQSSPTPPDFPTGIR